METYYFITKRDQHDDVILYNKMHLLSNGNVIDMFTGNIQNASIYNNLQDASDKMQYLTDRDFMSGIYHFDYDIVNQNGKEIYF